MLKTVLFALMGAGIGSLFAYFIAKATFNVRKALLSCQAKKAPKTGRK